MSYDWRNYISVLTPTAFAGDITFQIDTFNASPNITLTVLATSASGQEPISLATNLMNQLNFWLNADGALYDGNPVFSEQNPAASFYVNRTDHIVSIWSQSMYRIQIVGNTTGASLQINSSPTFMTLAEAKAKAPLLGVEFEDANEEPLTDSQIEDVIQMASDQVVKLINNNLVYSCYLHEYIGCMTGSMIVRVGPIGDYDPPMVRRPSFIYLTAFPYATQKINFDVDRRLKVVNYRFSNGLFNVADPYEMNNEIKFTYRAGYMNIPNIVKEKVIQIVSLMLNDTNVKSLAGGSFKVEFRLPIDTLNSVALELRAYKSEPN